MYVRLYKLSIIEAALQKEQFHFGQSVREDFAVGPTCPDSLPGHRQCKNLVQSQSRWEAAGRLGSLEAPDEKNNHS